jgi:hypothetical protein
MNEPQQVVYRYTIDLNDEPRITIPWHPASRVVHTALLDGTPDRVHFWVAMPILDGQSLPFNRSFYIVGTGHPFPATDIVEGVTVWDSPRGRLVWQLIRHEPGHTTN